MSKRKSGIGTIEINKKFNNEIEAELYMKKLDSYIRYISKKKKYKVSAMIVISNMNKGTSSLNYEINNKKGRPKALLEIRDNEANKKWYKGNYNVEWHIHILLLSSPSYALRNDIKKYIDKNWKEIKNLREIKKFDINDINKKKIYKKKCNIKIADYFIEQSYIRRFININHSKEEDYKYSIKDYYSEYMKIKSAKKRLYRKDINNHIAEDKFIKALNKINSKYEDIEKYLFSFSKENDKKINEEFINNVVKEKINMNKVQRNRLLNNYNLFDLSDDNSVY